MEDSELFRNWKAILDLQPPVKDEPLAVSGEYNLDRRCGGIRLQKKVPQGTNPAILILDIVAEGAGDGEWEETSGSFGAGPPYRKVHILDDKGRSTLVDVQEVHLSGDAKESETTPS